MKQSLKIATPISFAALVLILVALPVISQQGEDQPVGTNEEALALHTFSGGPNEGIRKVSQDVPQSTTSTLLFINLAGATTTWFVPAGDFDTLNVGFSGECRLINSMLSNANQDWVEIRAQLSRVPAAFGFPTFMEPYDTVSPMAFCSANGWAMHHANWAARVSGGTTGATYRVQIQYKVTNSAPVANALGVLRAILDDWKLELAAYN